ncbi:hypothetical protein LY76DRAFT_91399 [Colletotrichum caudatum]|nr:hypothetical protein LY76DRAFT_91399 [Colletotrichum caudatum]
MERLGEGGARSLCFFFLSSLLFVSFLYFLFPRPGDKEAGEEGVTRGRKVSAPSKNRVIGIIKSVENRTRERARKRRK